MYTVKLTETAGCDAFFYARPRTTSTRDEKLLERFSVLAGRILVDGTEDLGVGCWLVLGHQAGRRILLRRV